MKLKSRIQHLEYELSKYTTKSREASRVSPYLNIMTINSRIGGRPLHIHCEGVAGQPQAIARSVTHKSRLFGQSHWEVNCSLMVRNPFNAFVKSHHIRHFLELRDVLTSIRFVIS